MYLSWCDVIIWLLVKAWHLVNPKIAGKWMFIPLELIIIGFDPPPFGTFLKCFQHGSKRNLPIWQLQKTVSFSWQRSYETAMCDEIGHCGFWSATSNFHLYSVLWSFLLLQTKKVQLPPEITWVPICFNNLDVHWGTSILGHLHMFIMVILVNPFPLT